MKRLLLALVMALCHWGCAPSPLVRQDDATFRQAKNLFRHTLEMQAARAPSDSGPAQASPEENALFLQAEAFYRYRPEIRPPGGFAMAAQTMAASTDFAPLSVWAAGAEIHPLRMQAYNGAVQLYEETLREYPGTPLRPLILYRLGWAYRSISIRGFPRDQDRVVAELRKDFPGSQWASLGAELESVPYRTQEKAAAWSILPGAGQMYIGNTRSGLVRFTIAAAFASAALIPPLFMIKNRELDWPGLALSAVGFIGLQVSYTLAFQDAQSGAILFNEREEDASRKRHPEAP
ncbi:MAG: Outer rane lipoprotein [Fibrobacteres bacterium]|nr:Outer rane lipoprotein [Fibrobacterota bacterium]